MILYIFIIFLILFEIQYYYTDFVYVMCFLSIWRDIIPIYSITSIFKIFLFKIQIFFFFFCNYLFLNLWIEYLNYIYKKNIYKIWFYIRYHIIYIYFLFTYILIYFYFYSFILLFIYFKLINDIISIYFTEILLEYNLIDYLNLLLFFFLIYLFFFLILNFFYWIYILKYKYCSDLRLFFILIIIYFFWNTIFILQLIYLYLYYLLFIHFESFFYFKCLFFKYIQIIYKKKFLKY